MTKHFFTDTSALLGRSLRHILRSPDTIITTTNMPTETMPGPVRAFAEQQPVTSIVDAIRELSTQQPVGTDIWVASPGVSASSSSPTSTPWSRTAEGAPSPPTSTDRPGG